MEKKIELEFPKTIRRLADNRYGRETYDRQVEENIDFSAMNIIVFPPGIVRATSSFVQGFFSKIIDRIGYDGIESHIRIESQNPSLTKSVWSNLV